MGDFTALTELPCLVRELTDEEVLDIQIHENLHREDVHPIDEAYGYQVLREKLGCEVSEVAARVGKSEAYVLNRLKLNSLVPEVERSTACSRSHTRSRSQSSDRIRRQDLTRVRTIPNKSTTPRPASGTGIRSRTSRYC